MADARGRSKGTGPITCPGIRWTAGVMLTALKNAGLKSRRQRLDSEDCPSFLSLPVIGQSGMAGTVQVV